jgi:hypothetical protein
MPTRSIEDRAARAEARRRARMQARGELPEPEDEDQPADEPEARRGGFLRTLFPPAPPLPNRPDPLAGFEHEGPMRPVRERLFLLRSNLLAWTLPSAVAFVGLSASRFYGPTLLGMLATFLQFGALIAAGWIGWQRPGLYGAVAGVLSGILSAGLIIYVYSQIGAPPGETFGLEAVVFQTALELLYWGALGFVGGWYGGYLRRRHAQLGGQGRRRR